MDKNVTKEPTQPTQKTDDNAYKKSETKIKNKYCFPIWREG